jgi:hypothetical protein
MILITKEVLSFVAIALTIIAFIPYISSIKRGATKPHVFSWMIWGSATLIVFIAQLSERGGAGAWPIGVSGLITLYVAFLAYQKKADCTITRLDWLFFIIALSAIPFWYITSNPLWAVVLLTIIDAIGYFPTFRKAYIKPFEEQLLLYILMALRNFISMTALEHYSLTTVLFPATFSVMNLVFVGMVFLRRKALQYQSV